jgi:hypothetical protein
MWSHIKMVTGFAVGLSLLALAFLVLYLAPEKWTRQTTNIFPK